MPPHKSSPLSFLPLLILLSLLPLYLCQTCPSYKYYDTGSSSCLSCSYYCKTCTSSSDCTSCDSATDKRTLYNQRACVCQSGFFDPKNSSVCIACTTRISNCVDCFYNSTYSAGDAAAGALQYGCFGCANGFFFSSNACAAYVVCPAGQGANKLTNVCQACPTGCTICTYSDACTQCNQANNYFLDTSTFLCVRCSLFGCTLCQTLTTCKTCNAGLVLTSSKQCQCAAGYYYNPYTVSCQTCSIYCLTCTGPSSYQCTSCNSSYNRLSIGQDCQCDPNNYQQSVTGPACTKVDPNLCQRGYIKVQSTNQCVEICGDGWRIGYQCDDGGVINTDGCSDACRIQDGFVCLNAGTAASVCRLSLEVQFVQYQVTKNQGCNQLNFRIDISPDSVVYSTYDLAKIMHFRGGFINIIQATYDKGWLNIRANYSRNLQGKTAQLQIKQDYLFDPNYPQNYQTVYNTTKSTFTLSSSLLLLNTTNNLKPNYYQQQTYDQVQRTKTGGFAVIVIMIIICIASLLIKNSLSVIVNVNAFQIAYISIVTVNGMHPVTAAVRVVRPVLGYSNLDLFQLSGKASVRVQAIGFSEDFANNFNIMFFVQIAFFVASILTNLASHKKPMIKLASSFLQRNAMLLILFNMPAVFFTLTLMIKPFILNIAFGAAASIMIIYQLAHLLMYGKDYFGFKQVFDFSDKGHFKKFVVVYFLARLGTCLSFSFINVEPLKSLVAGAAFEGAFILFISFVRPFYHSLNNIFMIVAQIMSISFFGSVYASQAENSMGQNDREKSVDVMVYLLGGIMLIALANILYSFIIDIKQGGKKLKAFNQLMEAKKGSPDKEQQL